jgi:hypothetical protein
MIGFNHLGRLGRLGNQMFQYAALRGISHNRGCNFCLPYYTKSINDGIGNMLRTELFDCFEMSSVSALNIQFIDQNRPIVSEDNHNFNENLFNNCPDWVSLYGFFQTEKYFKNVEDVIRKDFTFKSEILNSCKEMIDSISSDRVISLHVRRTDYLTNSENHTNLELEYYEKSLSNFSSDIPVIVFSDDTEWCKSQEIFSSDRFLISEKNSGYIDLCLMSLCTDFIIANSSFSWWGAWLSESANKIVYSPNPKKWFGPNNSHLNTCDILPKKWIIVE